MAIKASELNTAAVELHGISKRFAQSARPPFGRRKVKKEKLALDLVSMRVDTVGSRASWGRTGAESPR